MADVLVLGAGGHAKVVIDLLRGNGHVVVGCTSPQRQDAPVNGAPVLGPDDEVIPELFARGVRHAFVALGDNRLRARVGAAVVAQGYTLVNAIGRSAVISPSAVLGAGCAVMEGTVVNADAQLADLVILNTNPSVDHDGRIGHAAHIAPGCALAGCVQVGENAFVGAGARAIPGVIIGARAIVGAGAVVIRNVPDDQTWAGVPAALLKQGSR